MDVNRDEAERCLQIGVSAYQQGDREKALRCFVKSNSMYPSRKAQQWIDKVKDSSTPAAPRGRPSSPTPEPTPTGKPMTSKQKETTERILACKGDYYQVLGVERSDSSKVIEKAYRKIVLHVHPDKNSHPQAKEAFRILQSARDCLKDDRKREIYNATGSDPNDRSVPRSPFAGGSANPFSGMRNRTTYTFYGDFDDLFAQHMNARNFVFTSNPRAYQQTSFARRGPARSTPPPRPQPTEDVNLARIGLQIFLLIALALLMFLAGSPSHAPTGHYSFTRTRHFPREQVTSSGISYFIREDVDPSMIRRMEEKIEKEWLAEMMERCDRELQEREILLSRARQYSDLRRTLVEEELKLKRTPYCDLLEQWQRKQQNARV